MEGSERAEMIETTNLADKLTEMIRRAQKCNENSVLEYKKEPHSKDYDCELFKDILGLLNSFERTNEDRWLIYGVVNKNRYPKGFEACHPDLLDDANYQQKFKKISPRPHIEFITVAGESVFGDSHKGKMFAAFYIP